MQGFTLPVNTPPADQDLLDLARVRLADLTGDEPPTTLGAVIARLFASSL